MQTTPRKISRREAQYCSVPWGAGASKCVGQPAAASSIKQSACGQSAERSSLPQRAPGDGDAKESSRSPLAWEEVHHRENSQDAFGISGV